MTNNPNPAQSVEFYDGNNFEYTDPDGQIHFGKIQPSDSFDWEENAPEDWEEAEPFILAEYWKQSAPAIPSTPDDLTAYLETHFEISAYLMETIERPGNISHDTHKEKGRGGLYELAQQLADRFTKETAGTNWNGDFFDEMDKFIIQAEAEHRKKQNETKPILYENAHLRIRLTGTLYAIQYTADNYFAHYFQTLDEAKKYAGIQ
jgi:hypothetical protein